MTSDVSSKLRPLLVAGLLLIGLMSGCRSSGQSSEPQEGVVLNTSDWERVYAGRASLLLPRGTALVLANTEVNQVVLRRIPPGTLGFEQLWLQRVDAIKRGTGELNAHTTIVRDYPGQHTLLFDSTGGTGLQRTLEHWQAFGPLIFAGQTVMNLSDLALGEKAMQEVFAAITPNTTPQTGDFVLDGAVVHVSLNGRERLSLSWVVPVASRTFGVSVPLRFSLLTDVVAEPGKSEVLANLANLKQAAVSHGLRVTILRARTHALANLQGEESAVTLVDDKHPASLQFNARWGFAGRPSDALAPGIDLSADTDSVQNVDPAALLASWQTVSNSLRFR